VTSGSAVRTFGYTAAGAVATDDRGPAEVLALTYDGEGRLTAVSQGGQTAAQYGYNALGERVAKTAGATTHFHYDRGGRLIGESDAAGATVREYIHLDGLPLALVEGSAIRHVHVDHVGRPEKMTDAAGAVVWDAHFRPFGEVHVVTGSADHPQRFPGQYEDDETGYHYNYFRDYDPTTGRYLQPDPIGLAGGLNRYAYVASNPVNYVDPDGLFLLPALLGAASGALIDLGLQLYDNGGNLGCVDLGRTGLAALSGAAFGGGTYGLARALSRVGAVAAGKVARFAPGPYARRSIVARSPARDFTTAERAEINRIGSTSGCHTCGTTNPGTKSGNFIPDHQPPSALAREGQSQRLYPHCINCSREQGLELARRLQTGGP
jgi:RHS repeat-associated protein